MDIADQDGVEGGGDEFGFCGDEAEGGGRGVGEENRGGDGEEKAEEADCDRDLLPPLLPLLQDEVEEVELPGAEYWRGAQDPETSIPVCRPRAVVRGARSPLAPQPHLDADS